MKVFHTVPAFQEWRKSLPLGKTVGFVPTMGALHSGHESLLQYSVKDNDFTVLSIFVNPTQFNNPDDLKHYPKTFEADLAMAKKSGVDAVFAPDHMEELYPDQYRYQITESEFSKQLCGAHRPGHFNGVLSVVMKLLNLVDATRAYFGEKDYQQLTLIQGMVDAYFLKTKIIPCPTVREESGLAKSSRNLRMTADELNLAPMLYQTITTVKDRSAAIAKLTELGFKVDYLEDLNQRRYVAAHLGAVRLIDNVAL
jgi:pantoate--beta-alanine ligase